MGRTRAPAAFAWALGALGLAAWAALVVTYWPFTVDDTFISLRYADHLARGIGPTWNEHGPHAEGYTSPLWIALLAVAASVGADLELAAKALGVAAMLGAIACTARLAWELAEGTDERRPIAAGTAAFAIAAAPATAIHAVSGMETALATLLAGAYALALVRCVACFDVRRAALAAGLGLLLALTRPEANLVVGVASLVTLALLAPGARRSFALAVIALHAIPGAAYFAWRLAYYGHLLPLPFYVKAVVPEATFAGADDAIAFARALWIERLDLGVACAASIAVLRGRAALLAFPALALWLFFFVPAHEMGYDFRYFQPLVPLALALAAVGLAWIAPRGAPSILVPLVVVAGALLSVRPWLGASIDEKLAYGAGIARAHARIGRALGAIRSDVDRPVLASLDTGAIAYFSRWEVVDTWGLNEPEIATTGERDPERILAREPSVVIVISARPDAFVAHFEHETPLRERALARGMIEVARYEFLSDYHLVTLARPGTIEARALEDAGRAR